MQTTDWKSNITKIKRNRGGEKTLSPGKCEHIESQTGCNRAIYWTNNETTGIEFLRLTELILTFS